MKTTAKKIIFLSVVCIVCSILLIGAGYLYLDINLTSAENNTSQIPYSAPLPENSGVLLNVSNSLSFYYLDFKKGKITVIIPPEDQAYAQVINGYNVDYSIKGDHMLVSYIIDFVDGIEIKSSEGILRYTGVQVWDKLAHTADNNTLKQEVISATLKKISENGFGKKAFVYLIENSVTNLTVPDCYYWADNLSELCENAEFFDYNNSYDYE